MNLYWKYLENPYPLSTTAPNTFVIESPDALIAFLSGLDALNRGESSNVSILSYSSPVALKERVELVLDLIHFSLNNKKLLSAAAKKLSAEATNELHSFFELHTEGILRLKQLAQSFLAPLCFDEDFSFGTFLKAFPLSLPEDHASLTEKLCAFVDANIEFCKTELFVFLNLRDFLSKDLFVQFCKHCAYRQVYFVNVQTHQTNNTADDNIIILDSDLCQVLEKFSVLC